MAGQVGSWTSLAHRYVDGVRVDEMNSVTCGGEPGLQQRFGPALWALNILPLYAEAGVTGVNFQTRPYTAQNLIQTNLHAGGLACAGPARVLRAAGIRPADAARLQDPQVSEATNDLYTWAVRTPQGQTHVVITNVGTVAATVAVKASGASGNATVEALKAAGGLHAHQA